MKMIMSKHDTDASEKILSIKREITDIKERLSNASPESRKFSATF
jgi:hypothetical protein